MPMLSTLPRSGGTLPPARCRDGHGLIQVSALAVVGACNVRVSLTGPRPASRAQQGLTGKVGIDTGDPGCLLDGGGFSAAGGAQALPVADDIGRQPARHERG